MLFSTFTSIAFPVARSIVNRNQPLPFLCWATAAVWIIRLERLYEVGAQILRRLLFKLRFCGFWSAGQPDQDRCNCNKCCLYGIFIGLTNVLTDAAQSALVLQIARDDERFSQNQQLVSIVRTDPFSLSFRAS